MLTAIFALIVAGIAAFMTIRFVLPWFVNWIEERKKKQAELKQQEEEIVRAMAGLTEHLMREAEQTTPPKTLSALRARIGNHRYFTVTSKRNGQIDKVNIVNDENRVLNPEMRELLGSEGKVIINVDD